MKPEHRGDGIHLDAAELIALRPRCNALALPMHSPAASALRAAMTRDAHSSERSNGPRSSSAPRSASVRNNRPIAVE